MSKLLHAHFGNGITWWFMETDPIQAHIDADRVITYREGNTLTDEHKAEIEHFSLTADPYVSVTQPWPHVFKIPSTSLAHV